MYIIPIFLAKWKCIAHHAPDFVRDLLFIEVAWSSPAFFAHHISTWCTNLHRARKKVAFTHQTTRILGLGDLTSNDNGCSSFLDLWYIIKRASIVHCPVTIDLILDITGRPWNNGKSWRFRVYLVGFYWIQGKVSLGISRLEIITAFVLLFKLDHIRKLSYSWAVLAYTLISTWFRASSQVRYSTGIIYCWNNCDEVDKNLKREMSIQYIRVIKISHRTACYNFTTARPYFIDGKEVLLLCKRV